MSLNIIVFLCIFYVFVMYFLCICMYFFMYILCIFNWKLSKNIPDIKKTFLKTFFELSLSSKMAGRLLAVRSAGGNPFLIPKVFKKCFKHVLLMSGIFFDMFLIFMIGFLIEELIFKRIKKMGLVMSESTAANFAQNWFFFKYFWIFC